MVFLTSSASVWPHFRGTMDKPSWAGLPDLTVLQNGQARCTNYENHCVMQCAAYRPFCPTKILVTVVPWELLAQNYIIFRNPKILPILLFSKHKFKKKGKFKISFIRRKNILFFKMES